jgi:hypothetical protein
MVTILRPFPENHAFLVGINEYENITRLHTAVNDARRLGEILEAQGFIIHTLFNPTKSQLEAFLLEMYILVQGEKAVLFSILPVMAWLRKAIGAWLVTWLPGYLVTWFRPMP